MTNDRSFKLLGLFFLAMLLFNFPLLYLFGKGKALGGFPLLFAYIFIAWAIIIFFTARILESKSNNKPK